MPNPATVMLVDDSAATLDLMIRILEPMGYEIAVATNGSSALELAHQIRPDLILMDVAMPGMDGFQTCRKMKANAALADTPVIFVTARTEMSNLQQGYEVGCVDYIRKPFEKEEVLLRVRTQLELRRLNANLSHHNAQLSAIFGIIMEGTLAIDPQGLITTANRATLDHLGYSLDELTGRPIGDLIPALGGDHWANSPIHEVCVRDEEFYSENYTFRNKTGETVPVELRAATLQGKEANSIGAIIAFRDISTDQESQRRLISLLSTDHLTGLVNWKQFAEQLSTSLDARQQTHHEVCVLLLDLDDFRDTNDTYGHDLGDLLLTGVADRLRERFSEQILITRLGGDEFALMIDTQHCNDKPSTIAAQLLDTLNTPFSAAGNRIYLAGSVGIATSREVSSSAQEMIRAADVALSQAKEQGKNRYVQFSPDMQRRVIERSRITASLREGLDKDEFTPFYQPLIDAQSGRPVGAEALLRWKHGDEIISTSHFIRAAEHSGLIDEIGLRVLNSACTAAANWRAAGHPQYVSVNVSAQQLRNPSFFDQLVSALDSTHLDPDGLVLELTESTLMEEPDRVALLLERIRLLGVRLAIDDFGTGFSSLSYLSRMKVDILKIDRSFVHNLNQDPTDTALVNAIIDIARALKLEVVAEGVEEQAQREFLAERGCQTLQGFLFARPMPQLELLDFLQEHAAGHAGPMEQANQA